MKLKSYAKINLGLSILEKRPDGYHNIQTIMQPINFYDEIEILILPVGRQEIPQGIEFSSNLPPFGEDNLCFKTAKLFLNETKLSSGLKIKLAKKIWTGAGLGGGSSDSANILKSANELFNFPLTQSQLLKLATQLGSDISFFLETKPAFVSGKGDIIERLPQLKHKMHLILIFPDFPISTAWAYQNLKTKHTTTLQTLKEHFLNNNIEALAKSLHNDFEDLVFKHYPILKDIKNKLLSLGILGASLSGSGSCIYGILPEDSHHTITKFQQIFPNLKLHLTETI